MFPADPDALSRQALGLASAGHLADAVPLLRQAADLAPTRGDVFTNLGEMLRRLGRAGEAVGVLGRAVELAPNLPEAHFNLGNALRDAGREADAEAAFKRAIALRPNYAVAHFNLGNLLRDGGRTPAAANAFRAAVAYDPKLADAHLNLGNTLLDLKDADGAVAGYEEARRLKPDDLRIDDNIAGAHLAAGRIDAAREAYGRTTARVGRSLVREVRAAGLMPVIPPDDAAIDAARDNLRTALERLVGDPGPVDRAELHSSGAEPPMALAYHGRDDRPLKELYARVFGPHLTADPPPMPAGRPRVGVVVTRGHEGVFARCLGPIVEQAGGPDLDVAVVCSKSGAHVLRHLTPGWPVPLVPIPERVDEAAAVLRAERFSLLHYWEVGTDSLNYFLPYLRPAPVQAATWGWPVTTGVPAVAAFVSSELLEPPGADAHYTEAVVRLPSLPTCYRRPPAPPKRPPKGRFGFRPDARLYLCGQNLRKCQPGFDRIVRGIADADPAAELAFLADDQAGVTTLFRDRLTKALGPHAGRFRILPRLDREAYLQLLSAADVALDTPHYTGGANTQYDAVAAGTPVVTLAGPFHRGRWGAAVLARAGLSDLVAGSADGYVATAVGVAGDPARRADVSAKLSAAAALFDDPAPAAELRAAWLKLIAAAE